MPPLPRQIPLAIAALFAHPDDETFSIAGTIARYAAEGVAAHLYCATDGSAGRSSGVVVASRRELGALRRRELDEAAALIGFTAMRHGSFEDGALARTDGDLLIAELVDFLREHRPRVVLTFGPEGGPNIHADHRVISRAATAAFFLARVPTAFPEQLAAGREPWAPARLCYVTWEPPPPGAELSAQGLPIDIAIDITAQRASKREAFLLHTTQRDHLGRFETLALGETEAFALAAGVPLPAASRADDLFAGL